MVSKCSRCSNTKATRDLVLSRILDPAYSSSHSSDSPLSSVYMDCGGHLHDPDYHHFELPSHSHSHLHHQQRKAKKNFDDRLAWEREAALIDGDDEEEEIPSPRRSSFSSSEYSPRSSLSSPTWSPSLLEESEDEMDSAEIYEDVIPEASPLHHEVEPASLALRKQWLAVSLRFKVKAYRAKKRLSGHRNT